MKLSVVGLLVVILFSGCYLFPSDDFYKPTHFSITFISTLHHEGDVPQKSWHKENSVVDLSHTLESLIRYRYEFKGWSTSESEDDFIQDHEFTMGNEDITLYALWNRTHFSITFISTLHHEGDIPQKSWHKENSVVDLSNTSGSLIRYGYEFKGWSTSENEDDFLQDQEYTMGNEDITLYALWSAKTSFDVRDRGPTGGWIFKVDNGNYYETAPPDKDVVRDWASAGTYAGNLEVFTDDENWMLPDRDFLKDMYNNLAKKDIGEFQSEGYWTNEANSDDAWVIDFDKYANQYTSSKQNSYRVRPYRIFTLD